MRATILGLPALAGLLLLIAPFARGKEDSPFAPSRLATASGKLADPDGFYESADCGECHVDQYRDWKGSMHSRAHHDGLYLAFAKLARKEGGDALYLFCSSCHAPGAVATGEIPGGEPSFLTDEGVSCDICHSVRRIETVHAGGGANASIVLEEGETRFGPLADPAPNPSHESAHSDLHSKSELCSACHTLLHPTNGLVIENTFEEWSKSPYAEAGITCQDCHMRTVEQATLVARGMKPVRVRGKTTADGETRPDVHAHLFVGGNANGDVVGQGERHADEAVRRLKSAATMALKLPERFLPGKTAEIEVAITNVGAGHSIPTSITELRQVWIDLSVTDGKGAEVYRSGEIDADGRVDPDAVMYHAVLADENGEVTYLPWRAAKLVKEKLIGAKETVRERYAIEVPPGAPGPYRVRAVLRYRSAPQEVLDELFGKGALPMRITDMTSADGVVK